eukprot:10613207-Ditylum_brightwellii.AAC.1
MNVTVIFSSKRWGRYTADILYEEDLEDNLLDTDKGIDNALPIEPDALVGNLEEEMDTFD